MDSVWPSPTCPGLVCPDCARLTALAYVIPPSADDPIGDSYQDAWTECDRERTELRAEVARLTAATRRLVEAAQAMKARRLSDVKEWHNRNRGVTTSLVAMVSNEEMRVYDTLADPVIVVLGRE